MDDAYGPAAAEPLAPETEPTLTLHAQPVEDVPADAPASCDAVDSGTSESTDEIDAAREEAPPPADAREQERIVEALLFAADAPLTAARISDLVDELTPGGVTRCVAALNERYAAAGLTFRVEKIARGYQLLSLPEYQPWLARLHKQSMDTRLTTAAMETLAVIAYKQPAMRADVEAIRGVACGDQINRLREVGLVKIVGRAEVVGRPLLYGTTRKFLDAFGLGDLKDLPPLEEFGLASRPVTKSVEEVVPDNGNPPADALEQPLAAAGS